MAQGELNMPKLRLHKPRRRAVVTPNGRDEYCGKHGSDKAKRKPESLIGG